MQILNLPCTNLWLEADSQLIDFTLIDVTKAATQLIKSENERYNIEKSYILQPNLPEKFNYHSLALQADAQLTERNCEDILADEWYVGGNWFVDNKALCVVAYVNDGLLENHTNVAFDKLPYYESVSDDFKNQLLFQVTYKSRLKFFHDSQDSVDLSLDFASDEVHYFWENKFESN